MTATIAAESAAMRPLEVTTRSWEAMPSFATVKPKVTFPVAPEGNRPVFRAARIRVAKDSVTTAGFWRLDLQVNSAGETIRASCGLSTTSMWISVGTALAGNART